MNIDVEKMLRVYSGVVKKMPVRVRKGMISEIESICWSPYENIINCTYKLKDDEYLIKMYFFYSIIVHNYIATEEGDKYCKILFEELKNRGHLFGVLKN